MQVKIFNLKKEIISETEISSPFFSTDLNKDFFTSYFLKMKKFGLRERKANTKNRSEISCTTKKMYKQKGTGGARHGNAAAPQFVGGGISAGPRSSFRNFKLIKKESVLMRNMIISYKIKNNLLNIVEDVSLERISTSDAKKLLINFDENLSVLIISKNQPSHNSLISIRNLPFVKYSTIDMLCSKDLLKYKTIIFDKKILEENVI